MFLRCLHTPKTKVLGTRTMFSLSRELWGDDIFSPPARPSDGSSARNNTLRTQFRLPPITRTWPGTSIKSTSVVNATPVNRARGCSILIGGVLPASCFCRQRLVWLSAAQGVHHDNEPERCVSCSVLLSVMRLDAWGLFPKHGMMSQLSHSAPESCCRHLPFVWSVSRESHNTGTRLDLETLQESREAFLRGRRTLTQVCRIH